MKNFRLFLEAWIIFVMTSSNHFLVWRESQQQYLTLFLFCGLQWLLQNNHNSDWIKDKFNELGTSLTFCIPYLTTGLKELSCYLRRKCVGPPQDILGIPLGLGTIGLRLYKATTILMPSTLPTSPLQKSLMFHRFVLSCTCVCVCVLCWV